jgi:hypothetical protein
MGLKIGEPTFCVRDPSLQSFWKLAMRLFKRFALEKTTRYTFQKRDRVTYKLLMPSK